MNLIFAVLLGIVALLQLPAIKRKDKRWKINLLVLIASVVFVIISLVAL